MRTILLTSFLTSIITAPAALAIDLIGQTTSKSPQKIVAEVSGVVESTSAQRGDFINAGQTIASIKQQDFILELAKQKANVSLAEADLQLKNSIYKRYIELREKKSISPNELDIAKADYLSAQAQLELAKVELQKAELDLKNTQIQSNIQGHIVMRSVDSGAWVNQGDLLYTVVNIDTLNVELLASEHDLDELTIGQPVELWAESVPGQTLTGKIKRIGVEMDAQTLAYPVEIEIANPSGAFKPGMSIHATTTLSSAAASNSAISQ
ncbi:efflux RND transporter periplasmic adaptor subunit [Vibrio maerlii]|uniref:efflux RND transporter periplasmic adaptor subunit n=1 Tax=Vibrio maerlii TaxID=2231648 RepID=UPI000E3E9F55|nr:efflux RND transporter periplasmic adaptor subunit [Vibrio maerlii]